MLLSEAFCWFQSELASHPAKPHTFHYCIMAFDGKIDIKYHSSNVSGIEITEILG